MKILIAISLFLSSFVFADNIYNPKEFTSLIALATCVKRLHPNETQQQLEELLKKKAESKGINNYSLNMLQESMKYYALKPEYQKDYGVMMLMEVNSCVQSGATQVLEKKEIDGIPTYESAQLIEDNGLEYRMVTSDSLEKVVGFYQEALQKYGAKEDNASKYKSVFSLKIRGSNRFVIIEKAPDGTDITIH